MNNPGLLNDKPGTGSTLEVFDLECVRGHRSLFSDLNFKLESGSMLQVCGVNGSGKTSLLRILCGLSLPESGEVRWNGMPILANRPRYYQSLAYFGHTVALKGELTPVENLDAARALFARPVTLSSLEILHHLALDDCLDLPCRLLSAGQRQRVSLGRLLLNPGEIWILDEPATALDQTSIKLLELNLESHVTSGGMVIFTSHQKLQFSGLSLQQITIEQVQ